MRKTGLAFSVTVCMAAGIAAAGIKQNEGNFILEGDDYSAVVDGKTGMLLLLDVGGEPAVESMSISLTEVKDATTSVVQEGTDQVVVRGGLGLWRSGGDRKQVIVHAPILP